MFACLAWMKNRAENVAAALLAAIFITFLLQIFTRYVISMPLGWTIEFCLTLWLWLIFWCGAFVLSDEDHVKFDSFYNWSGRRLRRWLSLFSALVVGVSMLLALPATWDYITFYKIKKSATLGWRLDFVFGVYLFFAVMVVISAGRRAWLFFTLNHTQKLPHGNEPTA